MIRFRTQNHRSIQDEQELSLVATLLSDRPESLVRAERYDFDLLRVAAVYGPNASGKSTLFDALAFMRSAVVDSQRTWTPDEGVPLSPFALDAEAREEPSLFAVDLLLDSVRYEYGFVADSSRVLEEWLYAYPKGRRQEWFTRDAGKADEFVFSRLLTGENRAIRALTRSNSLFLSAAAQNNHESLLPIYNWFSRGVGIVSGRPKGFEYQVAEKCKDDAYREAVLSLLIAADLGISGLELADAYPIDKLRRALAIAGDEHTYSSEEMQTMRGAPHVQLRHRTAAPGVDVVLPFESESQGTLALFALAGLMVDALSSGATLVIDELDRSLHPHVASNIVRIFNQASTNPNDAQLIFNTHDTNLLDTSVLRRDQIWFTEKGSDGATRLFPLTDFRARKYENLERGYLQGRYGAVPSVGTPGVLQHLDS